MIMLVQARNDKEVDKIKTSQEKKKKEKFMIVEENEDMINKIFDGTIEKGLGILKSDVKSNMPMTRRKKIMPKMQHT